MIVKDEFEDFCLRVCEEKDVKECMFAGKMCLTDCAVENCAVMVLILLIKNMEKLSAVRILSQFMHPHMENAIENTIYNSFCNCTEYPSIRHNSKQDF